MHQSRQDIIEEITSHIRRCGGGYDEWYIGTSLPAHEDLFQRHDVQRESDDWIRREANSPQTAREVIEFFESTYGMDAVRDPRHDTSTTVYAYRKVKHTHP